MTMYKPPRRPQFFYTTAPLPCPYLAGRTERKVVTEIVGPDAEALHDRLSRAGFRRSHNIAYAPVCPSCQACVPIRIPVDTFQPDRTLRKIARANAGLEGYRVPARATAEQFQLFQRYQQVRHGDGDMASMSFYDYRAMVEDTPVETFIIEFRDDQDRLVSAPVWPISLGDGLSAVYSFFAPGMEKRSLGTHAVLWLIERARALGLPYVYLGYWVPESRKMAYKARFKPSEVLVSGTWRVLTDAEIAGGDAAQVTMVTEFGGLTASARVPDPDWLIWAREIQAIAQTGLAFSKDPYDRDRFVALRRLAARIMAEHTGATSDTSRRCSTPKPATPPRKSAFAAPCSTPTAVS